MRRQQAAGAEHGTTQHSTPPPAPAAAPSTHSQCLRRPPSVRRWPGERRSAHPAARGRSLTTSAAPHGRRSLPSHQPTHHPMHTQARAWETETEPTTPRETDLVVGHGRDAHEVREPVQQRARVLGRLEQLQVRLWWGAREVVRSARAGGRSGRRETVSSRRPEERGHGVRADRLGGGGGAGQGGGGSGPSATRARARARRRDRSPISTRRARDEAVRRLYVSPL